MADVNSPGAPWSGSVVDIGELGNDVDLQQDLQKFNDHDLQIDKKRQSEFHNSRTSLTQMNHHINQRESETKPRGSSRCGTQHQQQRQLVNHPLIMSNLANLTQIDSYKGQQHRGSSGGD